MNMFREGDLRRSKVSGSSRVERAAASLYVFRKLLPGPLLSSTAASGHSIRRMSVELVGLDARVQSYYSPHVGRIGPRHLMELGECDFYVLSMCKVSESA